MNYLADGFGQGFAIGSSAREKKKDREERDRLEQARRDFELDVNAKRTAAEKQLQDDRLVADAKRQFSQQGFQGGESQKERDARLGLQNNAQGFQGGESQKDRDARMALQNNAQGFQGTQGQLDRDARAVLVQKQLDQDAGQFNQRMPLLGAELGLKARGLDIQQDRFGTGDMGNTPPAPTGGNAGGAPVVISSQEEFNRLPSKTRFSWNGRIGVKP